MTTVRIARRVGLDDVEGMRLVVVDAAAPSRARKARARRPAQEPGAAVAGADVTDAPGGASPGRPRRWWLALPLALGLAGLAWQWQALLQA